MDSNTATPLEDSSHDCSGFAATSDLPPDIVQADALWALWLAEFERQQKLESTFSSFSHGLSALSLPSYDSEIVRDARRVCSRIIKLSIPHIGGDARLIKIDECEYIDRLLPRLPSHRGHVAGESLAQARAFRPSDVYRAVLADYPPRVVQALQSAELATKLYSGLGLAYRPTNTPDIERRSGWVIMDRKMWTESVFGQKHGSIRWSVSSMLDLASTLKSLPLALQEHMPAHAIETLRVAVQDHTDAWSRSQNTIFTSRQRIAISEHLMLIAYKNKIEFCLSESAANALNLFFGQHLVRRE